MSARRLLLIDADPDFHRLLHEQLSPYGFEIYIVEESAEALSQVRDIEPEVIFIAVEEPDKVGYSLCNKAKKGVAKTIPVVLTTSTMPPSGFNSHRKLRVHADEYIDKRVVTADELIGKIDNLIGLGELQEIDDLEIPVDVEEMSIDDVDLADDEVVVDELDAEEIELHDDFEFGDEGEKTMIAPPAVIDSTIDAETDAAFDMLTDSFGEPDIQELPVVAHDEQEDSGGVPEPIDAADAGYEPDEPELMELGGELEPEPAIEMEPELEVASEAVPTPIPSPMQEPGGDDAPAEDPMGLGFELGLDEVAALAEEEQSGVHDRRTLQKIHGLEKENAHLHAELEKARAGAGEGAAKSHSREREFLNLREIINKKEKEILDLRDEVGAKDRQILDAKEKIRQLDHSRQAIDSKNLELEQRILTEAEDLDEARSQRQALQTNLDAVAAQLESALTQAAADAQTAVDQLTGTKARHAKDTADLVSAHEAATAALIAEQAEAITALMEQSETTVAELETAHASARTAALDALRDESAQKLTALTQTHAVELAEVQQAHIAELGKRDAALESANAAHAAAMAAVVAEHGEELAALTAAHAEAITAEKSQAERAKQGLADQHAGQLVRIEREKREAITLAAAEREQALAHATAEREQALAQATEEREQALAQAANTHEGAIAALASEHLQAIAALKAHQQSELDAAEDRRVSDIASAAEERAAAEAALQGRFTSDKNAMEQSHGDAISAFEAERVELEDGLASTRATIKARDEELAAARATIDEREGAIERHKQTLAQRDERITQLKGDIDELESQNAAYQEQILKAYQKIKSDESTVTKAKKALAIALTILDENITATGADGTEDLSD